MNATEDRDQSIPENVPAFDADLNAMPHCKRCNLAYLPNKSTSALKLTYCSFLCELGDLGFSMQGLEHMQRVPKEVPADPQPQLVAAAE